MLEMWHPVNHYTRLFVKQHSQVALECPRHELAFTGYLSIVTSNPHAAISKSARYRFEISITQKPGSDLSFITVRPTCPGEPIDQILKFLRGLSLSTNIVWCVNDIHVVIDYHGTILEVN